MNEPSCQLLSAFFSDLVSTTKSYNFRTLLQEILWTLTVMVYSCISVTQITKWNQCNKRKK